MSSKSGCTTVLVEGPMTPNLQRQPSTSGMIYLSSLFNGSGFLETGEHRLPKQEFATRNRVRMNLAHALHAQLVTRCASVLQQFLVLDGLCLDKVVRHSSSLSIELLERRLIVTALQRSRDSLAQIPSVVDAAVHPETAKRVVEMSGVAHQEDAPVREASGDSLMYSIDGAMDRFDAGATDQILEHEIALLVRQQRPIVEVRVGRYEDAPRPRYPQQHKPFFRIGHIVDIRKIGNEIPQLEGGRKG